MFLTASLAYGMYDNEYQVMARDWMMMNIRASIALCNCKKRIIQRSISNIRPLIIITTSAATRVRQIETITMRVAIILLEWNMFSICLKGPMRKHVLSKEIMLPRV